MGGTLDERLADWESRLDRLEDAMPVGYTVFVPSAAGYVLVDGTGQLPVAGQPFEVPGRNGNYRVLRVNGSPLPGDVRRLVYLEPI